MINVLAITACVLAMVSNYLVAHGRLKPVYMLGVINGVLFMGLNAALAISDPEQWAVVFLAIPSLWGIAMGIVGLRRLKEQR